MSETITQTIEKQYVMTFENRFGETVTPMMPLSESELPIWVENCQAEGRFIRFKVLE